MNGWKLRFETKLFKQLIQLESYAFKKIKMKNQTYNFIYILTILKPTKL